MQGTQSGHAAKRKVEPGASNPQSTSEDGAAAPSFTPSNYGPRAGRSCGYFTTDEVFEVELGASVSRLHSEDRLYNFVDRNQHRFDLVAVRLAIPAMSTEVANIGNVLNLPPHGDVNVPCLLE